MGTITVTIRVGDVQGTQFEELDVVVEPWCSFTEVPRAMLERLGVPVQRVLPSETEDFSMVDVDVGETVIELKGIRFHTQVIFAEEGEPAILGRVSLDEAALGVDRTGQLSGHYLIR